MNPAWKIHGIQQQHVDLAFADENQENQENRENHENHAASRLL